jgi:serine/threonine protein kinase
LSPEQAAGEEIHPTADVYVIGSILYEMLTGRPPFRASDELVLALQHLRQEPPSLQILAPGVPPALVQIVDKALAKEPAARYRNAGQLAQILMSQVGLAPSPMQIEASARTPGRTDGLRARPDQPPAQRRLVVPPPPAQSLSMTPVRTAPRAPREIADIARPSDMKKAEGKAQKSTGVDWLMIGLAILALIAVLGLIPLWRTVYRRYATPPPALAPALHSAALWWPDVLSPPSDARSIETTPARRLPGVLTRGRHLSAGCHPSAGAISRPAIRTFGSPAYGPGRISVVHCCFSA